MKRPPRVLLVMGTSAGGVIRHVEEVASILVDEGADVIVAAPGDLVGRFSGAKTVAVDIADRPRVSDQRAIGRIRRLARQADIVHAHGLRAGALTVLAARRIKKRDRPVVVVTEHNLPVGSWRITAVSAVLERLVATRADVVMGVSGDLVSRAISYGARRTERALVPAPPRPQVAASPDTIRAGLNLAQGPLIVTVARLAPQKGIDILLDTAARLKNVPGVTWLVAGDGPLLEHARRRVDDERLPVVLAGRREDIADLMSAADVFVSTSVWEGQPLVVQEAMSLGVPVVATDVGGTGEVTGQAAILVPFGDPFTQRPDPALPEELAAAIMQVISDPARAADLRSRSLLRSAELPTRDDVFEQLRRVYDPDPRNR